MNICLNPQESHVTPDDTSSAIICAEPHCGYLVNGAMLDGWRVSSLFGRGPMSDLYLAGSADSGTLVNIVVKVLRWDSIGPPTRLMESLRPLLALRHPHILPIQGVGWTGAGGKLYLMVPYAEFGSLMRYLQASAVVPPLAAAGLVLQMASALQYAHEQRVVHGRLKLDNCLQFPQRRFRSATFIGHCLRICARLRRKGRRILYRRRPGSRRNRRLTNMGLRASPVRCYLARRHFRILPRPC